MFNLISIIDTFWNCPYFCRKLVGSRILDLRLVIYRLTSSVKNLTEIELIPELGFSSIKCQRHSRRPDKQIEVKKTSFPWDLKLSLKTDEPQIGQRHKDTRGKRECYIPSELERNWIDGSSGSKILGGRGQVSPIVTGPKPFSSISPRTCQQATYLLINYRELSVRL